MCLISSLIKSYIPGKCFLCSHAGNMYLVYLVFFVYFVLLENESRKRKTPKQTFAVIEKLGNSGRMGGNTVALFKMRHLVRVADPTDSFLCIRRKALEKNRSPCKCWPGSSCFSLVCSLLLHHWLPDSPHHLTFFANQTFSSKPFSSFPAFNEHQSGFQGN